MPRSNPQPRAVTLRERGRAHLIDVRNPVLGVMEPLHYDTGGGILDWVCYQKSEGLRTLPYGPDQAGVIERNHSRRSCGGCGIIYTEQLTPQNYRHALRDRWPFPIILMGGTEEDVVRLIKEGRCAICGWYMGEEMMRHTFEGAPADQQLPKPEDAAEA